eukprot:scaffold8240_cov43-Prasinocladus_malaysianus.AAC.1
MGLGGAPPAGSWSSGGEGGKRTRVGDRGTPHLGTQFIIYRVPAYCLSGRGIQVDVYSSGRIYFPVYSCGDIPNVVGSGSSKTNSPFGAFRRAGGGGEESLSWRASLNFWCSLERAAFLESGMGGGTAEEFGTDQSRGQGCVGSPEDVLGGSLRGMGKGFWPLGPRSLW